MATGASPVVFGDDGRCMHCDGLFSLLVVARDWGRRYFGGVAVMEVFRAATELQIFRSSCFRW